jgi:hypothetical protein
MVGRMLLFNFTFCSNSFFTLSAQLIFPIILQVHILSLSMYFSPHSRNMTLLYKHFTKGDINTCSFINSEKSLSRIIYQFRQEAIQIRKAIHKMNTEYSWSSYFISTTHYFKNSINYSEHFSSFICCVLAPLLMAWTKPNDNIWHRKMSTYLFLHKLRFSFPHKTNFCPEKPPENHFLRLHTLLFKVHTVHYQTH